MIKQFGDSELMPKNMGGSPSTSSEIHIYTFFWFAANKSTMREISTIFNMGESTFENCLERVLEFFILIAPTIIRFPRTENEKFEKASQLQLLHGFPNVIGCIDGSYIAIRCPVHKIRSTYANRHDQLSNTLQGICDAKKKFLDVFTGASSKIHDSRIFRLSFIHDKLPNICGDRFHIIGELDNIC